MRRAVTFQILTLVIACNYSAFRLELCEDEYEQNHPPSDPATAAFTRPSLTWETYDKDNAVPPFVPDAAVRLHVLLRSSDGPALATTAFRPFRVLRDKSPPYA